MLGWKLNHVSKGGHWECAKPNHVFYLLLHVYGVCKPLQAKKHSIDLWILSLVTRGWWQRCHLSKYSFIYCINLCLDCLGKNISKSFWVLRYNLIWLQRALVGRYRNMPTKCWISLRNTHQEGKGIHRLCHGIPGDTWRNNVITSSKRRHNVVST